MIGEENGYFVKNYERLHILLKVQLEISVFQLGEFLNCFFARMGHACFSTGAYDIKNSNCPTVLIQANRHQRGVKLLDFSQLLLSKKAKWHIQKT